jgi:hypothetical protein
MSVINSWDEVPEFVNEEEEHEFWALHSLGGALLDQMVPVSLEDELTLPVMINSSVAEKDYTLTLHLPQDIVEKLVTRMNSPKHLEMVNLALINAVRSSDEPEIEEDLGWLDYLDRFHRATGDFTNLLQKMTANTTSLGQSMDQAASNVREARGSPQAIKQLMIVSLRTAKLINEHTEETKKDVLVLRQHITVMSNSYFGWLRLLKEKQAVEILTDAPPLELAGLQESIGYAIDSIKKYREAVFNLQGFQRDLNKASLRLANALQHLLDVLGEVEIFVEMAVRGVDNLDDV